VNVHLPKGTAGFTLVEVLVALTIFAMMVTATYGTITVGQRIWRQGAVVIAATDDFRVMSQTLGRLLRETPPLYWQDTNEPTLVFDGDASHLRFAGRAPAHHAAGYYDYAIAIEHRPNETMQYAVTLEVRPLDLAESGFSRGKPIERNTLYESARKPELAYFGPESRHSKPAWHSRWPGSRDGYPRIVRLSLPGEHDDSWPELDFIVQAATL